MVIGTTGHDKDLKQKIIDILGPIIVGQELLHGESSIFPDPTGCTRSR